MLGAVFWTNEGKVLLFYLKAFPSISVPLGGKRNLGLCCIKKKLTMTTVVVVHNQILYIILKEAAADGLPV